jgi:hypothetical protein
VPTTRGLQAPTIARTGTVLAWHAGIAVPLLADMVCR